MTGNQWVLRGLLTLLFFSSQVPGAWSKGKASRSKAPAHQKNPGSTSSLIKNWQDDEDRDRDLGDQGEGRETGSRFKEDDDDTYEEKVPEVKNGSKFKEEAEDTDTDTESQDEP